MQRATQFARLLRDHAGAPGGHHLQLLERLELSKNPIRDGGVEALSLAGQAGALPALRSLCLNECDFGERGGVAVCCALPSWAELQVLDVGANFIGDGVRDLLDPRTKS